MVKSKWCINVSNLFYWSNTLHVSDGLSVHHQELKTLHTTTSICQTDTANCLLALTRCTPGKDTVPIVREAGWAPEPVWTGKENLAPTGIRSPNRSARSQSLYRLRYAAHNLNPSAWGHLNPSSYCDVGRLFYGVFKLWSKLQRKKWRNNF